MSDKYKEDFKQEYNQLVIRQNKLLEMLRKSDSGEIKLKCPRSTYDMQLKGMSDYAAALKVRAVMEGIDL